MEGKPADAEDGDDDDEHANDAAPRPRHLLVAAVVGVARRKASTKAIPDACGVKEGYEYHASMKPLKLSSTLNSIEGRNAINTRLIHN